MNTLIVGRLLCHRASVALTPHHGHARSAAPHGRSISSSLVCQSGPASQSSQLPALVSSRDPSKSLIRPREQEVAALTTLARCCWMRSRTSAIFFGLGRVGAVEHAVLAAALTAWRISSACAASGSKSPPSTAVQAWISGRLSPTFPPFFLLRPVKPTWLKRPRCQLVELLCRWPGTGRHRRDQPRRPPPSLACSPSRHWSSRWRHPKHAVLVGRGRTWRSGTAPGKLGMF